MSETRQLLAMVWLALDFWTMAVIAVFALFCYVIYRLDKADDSTFKFHDLFTSGDWPGKASVSRLGFFGAFLSHSLVVIHQEMHKAATEGLMMWYALIWSGAYVALKAIELKAPPVMTSPPKGETNAVSQ